MADSTGPNPSNRDVQRNVNRNTNQQVQSIRKLVQGVPPSVEGAHNPDGSYVDNVTKITQGTKPPTSEEKNLKKQQLSVFQLLARSVLLIKTLINKLITKQNELNTRPLLGKELSEKFIKQLVAKISPDLFKNIDSKQLTGFFANVGTIAEKIKNIPNDPFSTLNTSLTNLNKTLSEDFTPQIKEIDITDVLISKISGGIDLTTTLNNKISGGIDLSKLVTSDKIVGEVNLNKLVTSDKVIGDIDLSKLVTSNKVKGDIDLSKLVTSNKVKGDVNFENILKEKLTGSIDLNSIFSQVFNNKVKGEFNLSSVFDNKIKGDIDLSKINLTPQLQTLLETLTNKIALKFDPSLIVTAIQDKIKEANIKIKGKLGLESPLKDGDKDKQKDEELPTIPIGNLGELSNQLKEKIEKINLLEKRIGTIEESLIPKFSTTSELLSRLPATLEPFVNSINSLVDKLNKAFSPINQQLTLIATKFENIKTSSLSKEHDSYNKNINDNLEKISNSITGKKDQKFKIHINKGKPEEKEAELSTTKIGQFLKTTNEVEEARNVINDYIQLSASELKEEEKSSVPPPIRTEAKEKEEKISSPIEKVKTEKNLQTKALIEKVDAYGDKVALYIDSMNEIQGRPKLFENFKIFKEAIAELKKTFNIDISADTLKDKESISKIFSDLQTKFDNNEINLDELNNTLNALRTNSAFDIKGKQKIVNFTDKDNSFSKFAAIRSQLTQLIKGIKKSENPYVNSTLDTKQKTKFFTIKLEQHEDQAKAIKEAIKEAATNPLMFTLLNFLTAFGEHPTLDDVLYSKLGKKIGKLSQTLEENGERDLEGREIEKQLISSSTTEKETINNIIAGATGEGGGDITKAITNALGGKAVTPGLGLGGGASGAGSFLGVGGAAGTALGIAGTALAAGTAAAGIYGAINATKWDRLIGNTNGLTLLGNTAVDGAFASINHYLGRGFWSRIGTALLTGRVSSLWGKNNLLEDEYTEAEHKAQMSMGDDYAKKLQQLRQTKLVEDRVKTAREQNVHFGLQQTINDSIKNFEQKQIGDINTSSLTGLNREQLTKVSNTYEKAGNLVQYSQKMLVNESSDLNRASTILDTIDDKVLDADKKRKLSQMWEDILNKDIQFNDSELPETIRVQRLIVKDKDYLKKLNPTELAGIEEKLATFKYLNKWQDSSMDSGFLAKLKYKDGPKKGEEKYDSYDKNDFRKHFLNYQNLWLLGIIHNLASIQKREKEYIDKEVKARVLISQLPPPLTEVQFTPNTVSNEEIVKESSENVTYATNLNDTTLDTLFNRDVQNQQNPSQFKYSKGTDFVSVIVNCNDRVYPNSNTIPAGETRNSN